MSDTASKTAQSPLSSSNSAGPDILIAEEEKARRKYVQWGTMGGIVIQTFYALYNLYSGSLTESILDFSSIALLAVSLGLIKYSKQFLMGYRLGVFTLIYVNIYTGVFPAYETLVVLPGFFSVPVVLFFILGTKEAMVWAAGVVSVLVFLLMIPSIFHREAMAPWMVADILISFSLVTVFSLVLELFRKETFCEYQVSADALAAATNQQRTLGELVPICSSCNKIRNDNGFWQNLEGYLSEHTQAHISSGICDACAAGDSNLKKTNSFEIPETLRSLSQWKDSEDVNKRKYIRLIILTGELVLLGYIVSGLIQGNYVETIGQIVIGSVLLGIAAVLPLVKNVRPMYHLAAITTAMLFLFLFFTPTPNLTDHFWLYLIPLTASFVLDARLGLFWSVGVYAFGIMIFFLPYLVNKYPLSVEEAMFFSSTYFLLSFFSITMERLRKGYFERILDLMRQLEKVYEGIRTLKGLVPVCSKCKAIRNDEGYWMRVDFYLYSNAGMTLSHGICPECLKDQMPALYEEMKSNGEMN